VEQATRQKDSLTIYRENLSPFSARGTLALKSFSVVVILTALFNFAVQVVVRNQLIPARLELDQNKMIVLYAVWFVFSMLGFWVVGNAFIKRWADICEWQVLPLRWRTFIRFALLSPVISIVLTLVTLIVSLLPGVARRMARTPQMALRVVLVGVLLFSAIAVTVLPARHFGVERISFRESLAPYVSASFSSGRNPFPDSSLLRPVFAVATPSLRYGTWLLADFIRAKSIEVAIGAESEHFCGEKHTFIGVQVNNCYFHHHMAVGRVSPYVSPFFAMYFETQYRKNNVENMKGQFEQTLEAGKQEQVKFDEKLIQSISRHAIAANLLMVSNQVDLLYSEPKFFMKRTDLLEPKFLLMAFGSPEQALVEAGQDFQRLIFIRKLVPIFDMQMGMVTAHLGKTPQSTLANVDIEAAMRNIKVRLDAIRRDPLAFSY
jgi:hypothetical protein